MDKKPTVKISPDFTVDDIHKIREANSEFTKTMTIDEKVAYYNSLGQTAKNEIQLRRAARIADAEQKKHTA